MLYFTFEKDANKPKKLTITHFSTNQVPTSSFYLHSAFDLTLKSATLATHPVSEAEYQKGDAAPSTK